MVESTGRQLVYSVSETAELLGISRSHAYELVAAGVLVRVRLGRRIVVPHHVIETLLLPSTNAPAAS